MENNEKKSKIMVISSHTPSLFWFRLEMMTTFIRHGFKVVAVGNEPEEKWSEKFAEYGIDYRQIFVERNGTNPLNDLKTFKSIRNLLKNEIPDKIFCYQAKSVIYSCVAAKFCGITEVYPLIAGLGSIFRATSLKGRVVKLVMATEYSIALSCVKTVMFQNHDDMDCFINSKILKGEKCRIINGSGVDTEKFAVMPMPDMPAFLMISRLIRDKGLFEYLNACRMIRSNFPDVRCMLVGPFDTNPSAVKPSEISEYIDDGTVEYFGEQTDVRPYIEMASVFVLPSYHEGTPKTVLESMSCGRAIITTDAPGCRETVIDGENGFLVQTHSYEEVAEKMEVFITNPELASEMGTKGRAITEEKYEINKVIFSIMKNMNINVEEENKEHVTV